MPQALIVPYLRDESAIAVEPRRIRLGACLIGPLYLSALLAFTFSTFLEPPWTPTWS